MGAPTRVFIVPEYFFLKIVLVIRNKPIVVAQNYHFLLVYSIAEFHADIIAC